MGAGLIQPPQAEIVSAIVALVLIVASLTIAYGAELGSLGQMTGAFELRRAARGGGVAVVITILVVLLSYMGFLFPQPEQKHIIPPQRPQLQPPESDRVLFTYSAAAPVPLRLGVIDVYDTKQQAWLLPPYDVSRVKRLQPPARVPSPGFNPSSTVTVGITVGDYTGHSMPSIGGLGEIRGLHDAVEYDARTNEIALADKPLYLGLHYDVVGAALPTGKALSLSPKPSPTVTPYLAVPVAPNAVLDLLTAYSKRTVDLGVPENPFDRLQFLRQALYNKVVAAGPGVPRDLTVDRVAAELKGSDASPYEITATEALLARWAGVPARLGYGYYGGNKQGSGYEVHPRDGAMWLEVYFEGYGWIPIVGVPPKAKPSTSQQDKTPVNIAADNRLQLLVLIPVRQPTFAQLFEIVRWWLVRIVPSVLVLLALIASYPWFCKRMRSRRRRRWAEREDYEGRIAVAYAEFRDRARDLTIGNPAATPVGFLPSVTDDKEHRELAWLVTRALWGDLRRDLRADDAEAAEALAASVSRRLDRAQAGLNRMVARIARTSLREPYSDQLPNFWWEPKFPKPRLNIRALLRRGPRSRRPAVVATAVMTVLLASCAGVAATTPPPSRKIPTHMVPDTMGELTFKREPGAEAQYRNGGGDALVDRGLIYSIHHQETTYGAVQVAVFKSDVDISDIDDERRVLECAQNAVECPGHEIFKGIQANLGGGRFDRVYYRGYERAYRMDLTDQHIYMWFPPGTHSMVTLILIGEFTPESATLLFQGLIDYQHQQAPQPVPLPSPNQVSATPSPPLRGAETILPPSESPAALSPSASPSPSPSGAGR